MKTLLKRMFRPIYRLGQKVLLRTLSPSFAPLLEEIRQLKFELEHAERPHLKGMDPVRCYRPFTSGELTAAAREQARQHLGLPQEAHLMLSLGTVTLEKGVRECLQALEQLRYWGAATQLHFVGRIDPGIRQVLFETVASLSLEEAVHFHEETCSDQTYRNYLIAADFAIQIHTHNPGGFSGAFLDCIASGLPTLSNLDLAMVMNHPSYVTVVPNQLSPLLIAEELLTLYKHWASLGVCESARERNVSEHASTNYSPQILKLLLAS